jgi:recombination protein RecA
VGRLTMPAASALRLQIEQALETRFPSALSPAARTVREVASTGIDEADELLDGGLPVGAISEISGPASSGRTSLALSFVAQRTAEDRVCAWVDACDAFDPESAAASGVALRQLLWVRCTDVPLLSSKTSKKTWTRLDQALRATDLLLQAGGFAAIVLDVGDIAAEYASRIPLATWFRFRQAAERTHCCLIVLAQSAHAQSSAVVALQCEALQPETAGSTVLRGFTFKLQRGRQRFSFINSGTRKPPVSTWSAGSAWSGTGTGDAEKRA